MLSEASENRSAAFEKLFWSNLQLPIRGSAASETRSEASEERSAASEKLFWRYDFSETLNKRVRRLLQSFVIIKINFRVNNLPLFNDDKTFNKKR